MFLSSADSLPGLHSLLALDARERIHAIFVPDLFTLILAQAVQNRTSVKPTTPYLTAQSNTDGVTRIAPLGNIFDLVNNGKI